MSADNNSFIDLQNGFLFNGGHNNFVFDNYFQDVDYVAYLGGECKDNATYQNLVEASKWPAWAKYKDQKPQMTVPKSFGDFYKQTCPGGTFNQFKRNRYCRVAKSFFKAEPAAINTSVMEDNVEHCEGPPPGGKARAAVHVQNEVGGAPPRGAKTDDIGDAPGASIVDVLNISFSCNVADWGPAPTCCVNSTMAQYLPLSGEYFGHDVEWEKFPEAKLWRLGDGLTWTDDIPICHHNPSVGDEKVNISSFIASIRHYKLATTFCSWGNSGGDGSTSGVAEWGYDWYATPATATAGCARFGRGSCNATTRSAAFACVRQYWQCRVTEIARSHHGGAMSTMLGHYLLHHYSALWSMLTVVGSEVAENIDSIQAHFAFNRGAARQFHLPWFIDFSDWNAGDLHGFRLNATSRKYDKQYDGHSISLRERVAYLTYMAGASKHKMEDPSLFLDNNETTAEGFLPLSSVGESAQRTHAFFASHPDRGIPFAPIAIMINTFHGMGLGWWNLQHRGNGSRTDWESIAGQPNGPFGMAPTLPYTEQDNYSSLLFNTIWPESLPMNVGTNAHDESTRLVGSKYSELWDVLIDTAVNDVGSRRRAQAGWDYNLLGCPTCGGYRVVMLTGDVDFDASAAAVSASGAGETVGAALNSWVSRGGVLVMTAPVLLAPGNHFSEWPGLNLSVGLRTTANVVGVQTADGAWLSQRPASAMQVFRVAHPPNNGTSSLLSLVTADGKRLPAVTETKLLHGKVVVVHPPAAADLDALHILDWVLDRVTDGVTPFSFTGGRVQTLLNRRPTGWNLTIVNNLGVTKTCKVNSHCSQDIIDPTKAQTVTVKLKPEHARLLGNLSSAAVEHVTRTPIEVSANSFTITVPSGAVRIIGVEHEAARRLNERNPG